MTCSVVVPADVTLQDLAASPACLARLRVQSVLLRRFQPEKGRAAEH